MCVPPGLSTEDVAMPVPKRSREGWTGEQQKAFFEGQFSVWYTITIESNDRFLLLLLLPFLRLVPFSLPPPFALFLLLRVLDGVVLFSFVPLFFFLSFFSPFSLSPSLSVTDSCLQPFACMTGYLTGISHARARTCTCSTLLMIFFWYSNDVVVV